MRFHILRCLLCATCLLAVGCHDSRTDAVSVKNMDAAEQVKETVANSDMSAGSKENETMNSMDQWINYYKDSKNEKTAAVYEDAIKIINSSMDGNPIERLNKSSGHLGSWYYLKSIDSISSEELDEPVRHQRGWVVDMSQKKIIKTGDYQTALPMFIRLCELALRNDSESENKTVSLLAEITSAIGFNHTGFVEDPNDNPALHQPKLIRQGDEQYMLEYFFLNDTSNNSYKKVTLKVSKNSVEMTDVIM